MAHQRSHRAKLPRWAKLALAAGWSLLVLIGASGPAAIEPPPALFACGAYSLSRFLCPRQSDSSRCLHQRTRPSTRQIRPVRPAPSLAANWWRRG